MIGTANAGDQPAGRRRCVGRESELSRLTELHREAQSEGERLAIVEGPSGCGKSRLLQELKSRVRLEGGVVLEGHCEPGRAFAPFASIVDRSLRFLDDMGLAPTINLSDLGCVEGCHGFWHEHAEADPMPGELAGGSAAHERRMRFFEAIRGLLLDVSRVRAPLVLLHDLERADHGTLQLIRFIFEGTGPWSTRVSPERTLKALVVASTRSDVDDVDPLDDLKRGPGITRIELGHLDAEGVRAYLQDESVVKRVLARTGGMPDAIELLLESEPIRPEELLQRKLRALGNEVRDLLEALACLDHPSDLETLEAVAELKATPAARQQLAASDLIQTTVLDGRVLFGFARERNRDLTYALLDLERRRELHRRCAAHFASRSRDRAAYHALEAGDFEQAIPLALDEARNLAARHAHGVAAALLQELLERVPDELLPVDVHQVLAEMYRVVGDYKRALEHAEITRRANPQCAHATLVVGRLLTLSGELEAASERLMDAHGLAEPDGRTRLQVETHLAELNYQRASYDAAEEWAERALAETVEDLQLEIEARNILGKVALARKEAATAATFFEQNCEKAKAASLGHQLAQALTNLGVSMLRQQELREARSCFQRAVEVAIEVNDSRDLAIATENLAVLAHLRRDYAEALEHYHQAVSLLKRLGNRAMLTRVGLNLGWLYLSLGDAGRARALSDFAQHVGGSRLPALIRAECLLLRGQIDLAQRKPDHARGCLEASLDTFRELGSIKTIQPSLDLARIALEEGNVARARQLITETPTPDSPKYLAEIAILSVDMERAAGDQDLLPATQRALRLAEETEDDELLLEALLRVARAQADVADVAARDTLARAQQVETRLTSKVPKDALNAWSARSARRRLAALETLVLSGTGARRISSLPPRATRSGALDDRYPDIVGSSSRCVRLLEVLDKVASSDASVLVRGESGTGKELVADALHRNSRRRNKPLVKVNCAALVETLLMSELFGHERGAFTGATSRKKGRFEVADGGTLFLDEIGDISPKMQVALLRVLQEREFERVGGTSPIKVDVRIIAATHRNLEAMVEAGTFREDLYYRLRGVMVEVPSLRERLEDLPELSEHLLCRIAAERDESQKELSSDVLRMLEQHSWPGNVRELENVLRSATLFAEGVVLKPADLSAFAGTFADAAPSPTNPSSPEVAAARVPLEEAIYERVREGNTSLLDLKRVIERECIIRALHDAGGNITRAAELLGMKRPRLSQLVKQYGLTASKASQKRVSS